MRSFALTVLVLGIACSSLEAQGESPGLREVVEGEDTRRSSPLYVAFGFGAAGVGVASNASPLIYSPTQTVPTISAAVGGLVAPSLGLELDLFGWFNFTHNGTVETVTTLMAGGRLHPFPRSGLYLRAGAGIGAYVLEWEDSWWQNWFDDGCGCDAAIDTDVGLAWSVGAGYAAPIGGGFRLGPSIELIRMHVAGPSGYRQRIVNVGLTLTFDDHH
jgi:hypothetical protein